MDPCSRCGGRLFIRTVDGWAKCTCYADAAAKAFIKPQIRGREESLPDAWQARPPWPLEDRIERGSYDDFRRQVWRSLLPYVDTLGFTYDYFDAARLVEIQFGRDTDEYQSVRDLKDLDLLVLVVGLGDPRNEYLPQLLRQVTVLRQMYGKPTWMYEFKADTREFASMPVAKPVPVDRPRVNPDPDRRRNY